MEIRGALCMHNEIRPSPGRASRWIPRAVDAHLVIPSQANWQILRGGRSNRLWRVRWRDQDIVIKIAAGAKRGNPLFPNLPESEYEAMQRLAPHGLAPEPIACLKTAAGMILAYRHVRGIAGRVSPTEAALTLRKLHDHNAGGWVSRVIPSGSGAIAAQARAMLASCPSPQARRLLSLAPSGLVPPTRRIALLHGDPVPANLVAGEEGTKLIDWQCPAAGDPCEDIAIHLSPAMKALYGHRPLRPREKQAFLAAYGDPEITARYRRLAPFFHWRMAAYCLWKFVRGAREYGSAMRLEIAMLGRIRA